MPGAVVGALYAAGHGPFELQKLAIQLDEAVVTDWSLFERGVIKGEALERFINTQLGNRPLEGLRRRFAVVATDLQSGEPIVPARQRRHRGARLGGDSRRLSAGGDQRPRIRRWRPRGADPGAGGASLGADVVVAVDISGAPQRPQEPGPRRSAPRHHRDHGRRLARASWPRPTVIRPELRGLPAASFQQRHEAILEGEKVGFAALARVREALAARERKNG